MDNNIALKNAVVLEGMHLDLLSIEVAILHLKHLSDSVRHEKRSIFENFECCKEIYEELKECKFLISSQQAYEEFKIRMQFLNKKTINFK